MDVIACVRALDDHFIQVIHWLFINAPSTSGNEGIK